MTFYSMDFLRIFSSSIEYQILIQLKVHLMHFNQGQISPQCYYNISNIINQYIVRITSHNAILYHIIKHSIYYLIFFIVNIAEIPN